MAQEKWLVDGPKVIDLENIRRLKVGIVGGSIDIVAHDEPTVRVEIRNVVGRDLLVRVDGDRLEIDHPQLRWDNWIEVFKNFGARIRAELSIVVPRSTALTLGVVSAEALVSGLTADADLNTVSGDIAADGLTGKLRINSVGGEITVRDHTGDVGINTVSGEVIVSGEVSRLEVDGVSSAVMLDATGIPDAVRVNTVSGSVTARLEADAPAAYTVHTVSGRLQLGDKTISGVRGRYTDRHGVLDGHWTDVRVNTVSGDINVLHSVTA
ncbi:DUF4097 family beta strand repeat-containing protein [Homoserinibacter sp. GY 40078]|uniref:DUF4097 family beta strand repeat-containing protein n=1 Tax=Homoserinibacter sp. GY 40078 TaxID=2603275 RepID=UPI0011C89784|nr:DUF4097 family beta strand repeat-containing protein [Homoserinibacter sp. GY 40078]TXK18716.1 DUF4097 domain-containing protein [Homoserinibacter sp. GY 40078]